MVERQVARMLADARAHTLVSNFVGQWLYLRNIDAVLPDPSAFTDLDENLRAALARETDLFFDSMLREDRSLLDLLLLICARFRTGNCQPCSVRGCYCEWPHYKNAPQPRDEIRPS